ncbi:hypothetical protein MXB_806 [Myxobolus squamalis]|nr:hypothetical protein MXB_806 [Myxobolus squamalis]
MPVHAWVGPLSFISFQGSVRVKPTKNTMHSLLLGTLNPKGIGPTTRTYPLPSKGIECSFQ